MNSPKVLVACEYSGAVRDAFKSAGAFAVSCDLVPTDVPGLHYVGDALDIINDGWDAIIAHPPCTYLCSSGLHWNGRTEGRQALTESALDFVQALLGAGSPCIAVENPVGCISSRIRPPDQYIQPHQFGHDASKRTGLWLKGLPLLRPTMMSMPRTVEGRRRWGNQTDSGQNNLSPSADRWKIRSATYSGIAAAMAGQWIGAIRAGGITPMSQAGLI